MTNKMPIPEGGSDSPPLCYLPVAGNWSPVLMGWLWQGLQDWFWLGTADEIEAAKSEVAKWVDILQECTVAAPVAIFEHQELSGITGGSATAASWNTRKINTVIAAQPWVSVANNVLTLDAGHYAVKARYVCHGTAVSRLRFRPTFTGAYYWDGLSQVAPFFTEGRVNVVLHLDATIVVYNESTFRLDQWATLGGYTNNFGAASGLGGGEIYGRLEITKID